MFILTIKTFVSLGKYLIQHLIAGVLFQAKFNTSNLISTAEKIMVILFFV